MTTCDACGASFPALSDRKTRCPAWRGLDRHVRAPEAARKRAPGRLSAVEAGLAGPSPSPPEPPPSAPGPGTVPDDRRRGTPVRDGRGRIIGWRACDSGLPEITTGGSSCLTQAVTGEAAMKTSRGAGRHPAAHPA